jgi:hypothetical protein
MTNTTATATTQALTVVKDGQDWLITNEAGEILARATSRKEAREMKAEIEAEIEAGVETPADAEAEFRAEIEGQAEEVKPIGVSLVKAYVTEVVAEAETITEDEEWVPAEDDTTETGEAPAVDVIVTGTVEAPVVTEVKAESKAKAKKDVCSGSSAYVGYWDEDVTEFTKKGRPAWVSTNCPGCMTKVRAGVWFTEKGEALNGERGLAYLPKH